MWSASLTRLCGKDDSDWAIDDRAIGFAELSFEFRENALQSISASAASKLQIIICPRMLVSSLRFQSYPFAALPA